MTLILKNYCSLKRERISGFKSLERTWCTTVCHSVSLFYVPWLCCSELWGGGTSEPFLAVCLSLYELYGTDSTTANHTIPGITTEGDRKLTTYISQEIEFLRLFYFMHISVLPTCVLCMMFVLGACRSQKRSLEALELELQTLVSHRVGTRNQTQILCKSRQYS